MPQYLAFLRGINLGNRRLKMDQLRALFEALTFSDVATFIASGNVAFASAVRDAKKLEATIERHLAKELGYTVDTFVRTRAEVAKATAHPAFAMTEMDEPQNTIHLGFLKEPLGADREKKFVACRTPVDELAVNGREIYWLCRIRTPDSKVWSSAPMKALAIPTMTMRNVTMLRKLVAEFP